MCVCVCCVCVVGGCGVDVVLAGVLVVVVDDGVVVDAIFGFSFCSVCCRCVADVLDVLTVVCVCVGFFNLTCLCCLVL